MERKTLDFNIKQSSLKHISSQLLLRFLEVLGDKSKSQA